MQHASHPAIAELWADHVERVLPHSMDPLTLEVLRASFYAGFIQAMNHYAFRCCPAPSIPHDQEYLKSLRAEMLSFCNQQIDGAKAGG